MSGDTDLGRGQLPLDLGHRASLGEADFLVSDGNRLAYAHVLAWPHWPTPLTLMVGPAKSGKSHLARIFADRSGAETVASDALERLARTGGDAPLIVEDADRGDYPELALFHLLNQAMRDNRALLITARSPIGDWPYRTEDVLSRARLATLLTVSPPDDVQLSQMLVKLFGDRQVVVEPKVVSYLVARMERSPEEAVALVDLLDRLAMARGSAITRSIAAEALAMRGAGQLELDLDDIANE